MSDKAIQKYTDPEQPGAFTGETGFKKNNKGESTDELNQLRAITYHKPVIKKFNRSKFYAHSIDHIWHVDLADVSNLKSKIYGQWYNYLLCAIDVFSKYAFVEPLTDKTANQTKQGLERIIKRNGRKPNNIYSDRGSEFYAEYADYCKENKIRLMYNDSRLRSKAAIVERFIRTLKSRLYRYFSLTKKTNYISVLQKIVNSYNNSYHTSIGMTPTQVNDENEACVRTRLYGDMNEQVVDLKYKVGDYVRYSLQKKDFSKGYTQGWSTEIYIINRVIPSIPPKYEIRSAQEVERPLKHLLYEQELQPVSQNEFPYDTFELVKKEGKQLLVKQLNAEKNKEEFWISKDETEPISDDDDDEDEEEEEPTEQVKPQQAKQVKSEQAKQVKPKQTKSEQIKPKQTKPEQAEQFKPEPLKPELVKPKKSKPDVPKKRVQPNRSTKRRVMPTRAAKQAVSKNIQEKTTKKTTSSRKR